MVAISISRPQRCAIYTRKSLEDQFDTEFNSIESQRDICAAYITCQEHKQWIRLPESYDDAGLSGASLQRPALQQMLRDVERGEIDIVGAGDAVMANLTTALAAKATLREALELSMAAASVVIHQLGTTGAARVEDIRAQLFPG